MNSMTRTVFLGWALLTLTAPPIQAQMKIATVDLKTVFDHYYKTRQADIDIKRRAADLDKVQEGMLEDYQAAKETFNKLKQSAEDPAISENERQRRQESLAENIRQIQELELQIRKFRNQAQNQLRNQENRLRENLVREIQGVIDSHAKSAGVNLVLDTAAEGIYKTPVILYSDGLIDLTDPVLSELNANAPSEVPATQTTSAPTKNPSNRVVTDFYKFNDLDRLLDEQP